MSSNRTHWSALIWLLLTSIAAAQPIRAQAKEMTLALVKALPDSSATARIVREPGTDGRTVILLREENADAITLATALTSLNRSRKTDGEELKNQIVITLHGLRSLSSLNPEEHRLADDYVSRLQKRKRQELPGFGPAKILVVTLDALRQISGGTGS
jgi:hypothetical protein